MLKRLAAGVALIWVVAGGILAGHSAQAQPAPPIYAYTALYRLDQGHWERSLLFEPGDRVRFVMPFLTPQLNWRFPNGTFRVQRERVPFYKQPIIFKHRMDRRRGAHGYTIFSVSFQMQGTRWLGHWIAEADVTNGVGLIGPNLSFTVLPHLPQLFSVADALGLCRAHPSLRQTIMVGGVWGEVANYSNRTARGWIADRWAGRGAIPRWWEHGVLWLTFSPRTNPGYPPPDGFLQVRSTLDCRTHALTAVARPVFQ
jgi:hypothetical protein